MPNLNNRFYFIRREEEEEDQAKAQSKSRIKFLLKESSGKKVCNCTFATRLKGREQV